MNEFVDETVHLGGGPVSLVNPRIDMPAISRGNHRAGSGMVTLPEAVGVSPRRS